MDKKTLPKHKNFDRHANPAEGTPEPGGIRPVDSDDPLDYTETGQTIAEAKGKTTKDLRDDIVEAAVEYAAEEQGPIRTAVIAYHDALRKADREGR